LKNISVRDPGNPGFWQVTGFKPNSCLWKIIFKRQGAKAQRMKRFSLGVPFMLPGKKAMIVPEFFVREIFSR